MEPNIKSGIEYPTIELGGKTYTVRFDEAAMYHLDKKGIRFNPQFLNGGKQIQMGFSNIVDVLKLTTRFAGTEEELAALVWPKTKRDEACNALVTAWGNLLLSSGEVKIRETAAPLTTDQTRMQ